MISAGSCISGDLLTRARGPTTREVREIMFLRDGRRESDMWSGRNNRWPKCYLYLEIW